MLYREIIAVCSEIHTKHINTCRGQNVELFDIKPGLEMFKRTNIFGDNQFSAILRSNSLHIHWTKDCEYEWRCIFPAGLYILEGSAMTYLEIESDYQGRQNPAFTRSHSSGLFSQGSDKKLFT
jgi:hypothetical protein